jgi:hypothetical protein
VNRLCQPWMMQRERERERERERDISFEAITL